MWIQSFYALTFLTELLEDPSWAGLALILRWGLLICLLWGLLRLPRPGKGAKGIPALLWLLPLSLLLLIALRQAQWQLLGRQNQEFVSFMQRYDRREFNPAHVLRAGRILDRDGRTLALSQVTDQGLQRLYPQGPLFSHSVGYNHPVYGMSGLEAAGRDRLLGLDAPTDLAELGRELLDREGNSEGPPLRSSLHAPLQRKAAELMAGRPGAVLVLDLKTDDLLVLLSQPDFDPNRLKAPLFLGREKDAPLINRAISGRYPPGSVWKILIAAAALNRDLNPRLDTPPEGFTTHPANPPIRDHEYYTRKKKKQSWKGRGRISMGEALTHSSNVYFAQLGVKAGEQALKQAAAGAGLMRKLSLASTSEDTLTVRPAKMPALNSGNDYEVAQFSIGQGDLLVSPMHVLLLSAAVANDGITPAPRLDRSKARAQLGRLCSAQDAEALKWMLYNVVQEGTGRGIRIASLPVGGKTGTAQTGRPEGSHSWFTGFAPLSKPRLAFVVLVEHGGYGSAAALPVARELLISAQAEGLLTP